MTRGVSILPDDFEHDESVVVQGDFSAAAQASSAFSASQDRPELGEAAYIGLLGEIVRLIGPQTEADPAGILLQTLAGLGNIIGRGPHFQVEATRHHLNLNVTIVGETSKSRKGTAFDYAVEICRGGRSSLGSGQYKERPKQRRGVDL